MNIKYIDNLKVLDNGQAFKIHNNYKRKGYKEIEVKYSINQKGYLRIYRCNKRVSLARFIWEVFNGEIEEGMEIDHIDGNKKK